MAEKNIQMKIKNGAEWDALYPNTKAELVYGLTTLLDAKVNAVAGKSLSTEDFTTAEKTKLTGIVAGANNYVHPTGAGNNHIPTAGASGDILKYSAAGTAAWSTLTTVDIPSLSLAKISDAGTGGKQK